MSPHPLNGFLVVDKPEGITSHDVVAMVRAVSGTRKVGHTGTLDPFATGVLPLALGAATRFIQFLAEDLKVYDATVQLGAATDTGDLMGDVCDEVPLSEPLPDARIHQALAGMIGERSQVPPAFSAVKVRGKPLYKYAREGKAVEAKARTIRVDAMELVDRGEDWLRVRITCGRGTYARVLGDELAQELGTRGHLIRLRRLRSGPFTLDGALTIPQLSTIVAGQDDWQAALRRKRDAPRLPWRHRDEVQDALRPMLLSPADALSHLARVEVEPAVAQRVRNGGVPPGPPAGVGPGQPYCVLLAGALVSVAHLTAKGPRSVKVVSG